VAQLTTKGTLTRSRWDFYEASDAWGFATGNIGNTSGNGGFLLNNGTGPGQLDIYYACVSFATATAFSWLVYGSNATFGINAALLSFSRAIQTDAPQPLGLCNIAGTGGANIKANFRTRVDPVTFDEIKPGVEGPFLSLPPGFALVVNTASPDTTAALTFLYQIVIDIVQPAS
jgi:hypothetical protein